MVGLRHWKVDDTWRQLLLMILPPPTPYLSNNSLLSLFIENAVPVALAINNTRFSISNIMITNSGSQRFDIYAGPFTKNNQLTASPASHSEQCWCEREEVVDGKDRRGIVWSRICRCRKWLEEMDIWNIGFERYATSNLTMRYVTTDACLGIGDDTLHTPVPFHFTLTSSALCPQQFRGHPHRSRLRRLHRDPTPTDPEHRLEDEDLYHF
ncbi:unnamed protein product [Cyclocybe aegerita]|uniref:Putative 5'-nucleotidase C-terminal domain-containing protein n=1 Tax=Cyclocybe aegerita TaxID=1973307 RepID=A0A8S0WWG4_CYCAE|nr:unnamed protein product [Cyclocybe aegerita]